MGLNLEPALEGQEDPGETGFVRGPLLDSCILVRLTGLGSSPGNTSGGYLGSSSGESAGNSWTSGLR